MTSHLSEWLSSMNQQTSAGDDVEKGDLFYTAGGNVDWSVTMESSMETSQKIKNGSAFWPSDPTSGNIPEGTQNTNLKEHKHLYVHCSLIYNHQDMEVAQVYISRWMDKSTMGHLYNGYYSAIKKKKILPFAIIVWMDLESIMLSEISHLEKDKYHIISLICGI